MRRFNSVQQQIIAGLEAKGWVEQKANRQVNSRSFKHPDRGTTRIFVSTSGPVRAGQNRLSSIVVSKKFMEQVMAAGVVALAKRKKSA